jgi:predicted PolB exonuclease-like 3'-5' exonuclease
MKQNDNRSQVELKTAKRIGRFLKKSTNLDRKMHEAYENYCLQRAQLLDELELGGLSNDV